MKKFDLSNIFNVKGKSARHKIINQFGLDKYDKRAFLNNLEELEKKAESDGEGSVLEEKDCNFYDCDGTLLYSYTAEEALSLIELPPLPIHLDKEIECIGYTHSLEEIINSGGILDIGCFYGTIDDSLRLLIEIKSDYYKEVSIPIAPNLYIIDWGDGTVDNNNIHTYNDFGKFIIKIYLSDKTTEFNLFSNNYPQSIQFILKEIFLPKTHIVYLDTPCFKLTYNLENIWYNNTLGLHAGTSGTISEQFSHAYNLKYICLQGTGTYSYCYNSCYSCAVLIIKNYNRSSTYGINFSRFSIKSLCLNNINGFYNSNNSNVLPNLKTLKCSKNFKTTSQIYGLVKSYSIDKCYFNNSIAKDNNNVGITKIKYLKYFKDVESIKNKIYFVSELDLTEFDVIVPLEGSITEVNVIKIKKELLNDYKNATNWSVFADKMIGI